MKIFFAFIFLIMSSQSFAVSLAKARSATEGTSVQKFILEKKLVEFQKQSTFFDPQKDPRIGIFRVSPAPAEKLRQNLEDMLIKVSAADKILKSKDSDFNALSGEVRHESFYQLNDFMITSSSILYAEVEQIFQKLQKLDWKQHAGYALTSDYKQLTLYTAGKAAAAAEFNFEFHCDKRTPPSVCHFKDFGMMYLE